MLKFVALAAVLLGGTLARAEPHRVTSKRIDKKIQKLERQNARLDRLLKSTTRR